MADEALYNKSTTTTRTGGKLWIQKPAATASGYEDYQIDPTDFLSIERDMIDANDLELADHEDRIVALENGIRIIKRSSDNTTFQITQPENSMLTAIDILAYSGTPTIKIGTTLGGDEIQYEEEIALDTCLPINVRSYAINSRTLYFTLNNGTIKTTITYSYDHFNV